MLKVQKFTVPSGEGLPEGLPNYRGAVQQLLQPQPQPTGAEGGVNGSSELSL